MHAVMRDEQGSADAIVMAAAVADFRPDAASATKIKKSDDHEPEPIRLVRNPDILADLVAHRPDGQVIVGFAAETATSEDELLALARAKVARKGCDLLVVNDVGGERVFGRDDTAVRVMSTGGQVLAEASGAKADAADSVLDEVAKMLPPLTGDTAPIR